MEKTDTSSFKKNFWHPEMFSPHGLKSCPYPSIPCYPLAKKKKKKLVLLGNCQLEISSNSVFCPLNPDPLTGPRETRLCQTAQKWNEGRRAERKGEKREDAAFSLRS